MAERHDIILRQVDESDDPGLFNQLKNCIEELFPSSLRDAGRFFKGKADQEVNKAAELKAQVFSLITKLDHERIALIQQRESAQLEHEREMYRLRTERLKEVVVALKHLRELGVEVQLEVIASRLLENLKDI